VVAISPEAVRGRVEQHGPTSAVGPRQTSSITSSTLAGREAGIVQARGLAAELPAAAPRQTFCAIVLRRSPARGLVLAISRQPFPRLDPDKVAVEFNGPLAPAKTVAAEFDLIDPEDLAKMAAEFDPTGPEDLVKMAVAFDQIDPAIGPTIVPTESPIATSGTIGATTIALMSGITGTTIGTITVIGMAATGGTDIRISTSTIRRTLTTGVGPRGHS
jgi:hypothetical protein